MKRKKILHCVACPGKKLIKDTKTTYTIKCPLGAHKGAKNPVKKQIIYIVDRMENTKALLPFSSSTHSCDRVPNTLG